MAGDVPLVEGVFLVPGTMPGGVEWRGPPPPVSSEHVLHEFGPFVRIAGAPEEDPAADSLEEFGRRPGVVPDAELLDPVGARGLTAFALRATRDYAVAKAERPFAGADWDEPEDAETPDPPGDEAPTTETLAGGRIEPMLGRIAVGLLIVDGPTDDLRFTDDEQTLVAAEVQNGLSWLGSQAPTGALTWVYDVRLVQIDVAPDPGDVGFEPREARWRDPVLSQLGHPAGMGGVDAYVAGLRRQLDAERGYCAFFTKYPLAHFAYAALNGSRLVMHFDNDNWGPANIDRVFAHETGHIFGAPDEYAASRCNCGGSWGTSGGPNSNCATCAVGGGVDCIMRSNEWAICEATPGHFGWTG
jgi:hypothetical protein